jgi:hypothetical protein
LPSEPDCGHFGYCADFNVATYFGYNQQEIRRLQLVAHRGFLGNLKVLLVSGSKDKDRFRNFRE